MHLEICPGYNSPACDVGTSEVLEMQVPETCYSTGCHPMSRKTRRHSNPLTIGTFVSNGSASACSAWLILNSSREVARAACSNICPGRRDYVVMTQATEFKSSGPSLKAPSSRKHHRSKVRLKSNAANWHESICAQDNVFAGEPPYLAMNPSHT